MCGKSFTRSAVLRRHQSIHYKSLTGVSLSSESDRKGTDLSNKPPQCHPETAIKAPKTLDQRFDPQLQQLCTVPPSDPSTEPSSASPVMVLQRTVPNRILAVNSGKYSDLDPNSKKTHALSVEVCLCPFSEGQGPDNNFQAADT